MIFVLTVKVFLVGHFMTFSFGKKQVLDEWNAQNLFAGFLVGDS